MYSVSLRKHNGVKCSFHYWHYWPGITDSGACGAKNKRRQLSKVSNIGSIKSKCWGMQATLTTAIEPAIDQHKLHCINRLIDIFECHYLLQYGPVFALLWSARMTTRDNNGHYKQQSNTDHKHDHWGISKIISASDDDTGMHMENMPAMCIVRMCYCRSRLPK